MFQKVKQNVNKIENRREKGKEFGGSVQQLEIGFYRKNRKKKQGSKKLFLE